MGSLTLRSIMVLMLFSASPFPAQTMFDSGSEARRFISLITYHLMIGSANAATVPSGAIIIPTPSTDPDYHGSHYYNNSIVTCRFFTGRPLVEQVRAQRPLLFLLLLNFNELRYDRF